MRTFDAAANAVPKAKSLKTRALVRRASVQKVISVENRVKGGRIKSKVNPKQRQKCPRCVKSRNLKGVSVYNAQEWVWLSKQKRGLKKKEGKLTSVW